MLCQVLRLASRNASLPSACAVAKPCALVDVALALGDGGGVAYIEPLRCGDAKFSGGMLYTAGDGEEDA